MEEWLRLVTKDTVIVIDAMALIVVATGTAKAFFTGLWAAFPARAAIPRFRAVLLRYGRWLVAGLTFQRPIDIIETSSIPSDSFWCANKIIRERLICFARPVSWHPTTPATPMFTRRAEHDRSTGQSNGAAEADALTASDREALRYAREIAALYPADPQVRKRVSDLEKRHGH